jgi:hypothetical protein
MKTWVNVLLAVVAAGLLVAAAAVLITMNGEEDDPPILTPEEEHELPPPAQEEADEDEGRPHETEPEIRVTEAWIEPGDCLTIAIEENDIEEGADEGDQLQAQPEEEEPAPEPSQACHRLRVSVSAGSQAPFDVGAAHWEARDDFGESHGASWVRSPDPVPAGGARSIVISFDVHDETRLVELSYEHPDGPSLTTSTWTYQEDLEGETE